MGWAARPGEVLDKDGPDEAGLCIEVSMYDRKKELTLFLHGDGVLGKLIRALERKTINYRL